MMNQGKLFTFIISHSPYRNVLFFILTCHSSFKADDYVLCSLFFCQSVYFPLFCVFMIFCWQFLVETSFDESLVKLNFDFNSKVFDSLDVNSCI